MAVLRGGGAFFHGNSNLSFSDFTLDASNDGVAFVCQAPEADTITSIGIRVASVTGTSPTYRIGFQTVQDDGTPDGTYLGGGSPQSGTFTPGAAGIVYVTLDNSRTVTRGEILCIVVSYSSGTIDASNNIAISYTTNMLAINTSSVWGFPYPVTQAAGTWTKEDDPPIYGMRSATRSYGHLLGDSTAVTWDNNSTPDEFGVAFTLPDICDSYTVVGAMIFGDLDTTGVADLTMNLYNDTTLLQSVIIESERHASTAYEVHFFYFDEATLSSLTPGTQYIVSFTSNSNTIGISTRYAIFNSAGDLKGSSVNALGMIDGTAQRTGAGAWTITTTDLPTMSPIIWEVVKPAGGGGGAPPVIGG